VRVGLLATLLATSSHALADPVDRIEVSGFLGVEDFSKVNGLGNSLAPEQRPQTAPMFGGRFTYVALETRGEMHLDFAIEAELSFAPSWTGYGFEDMRPSYFTPVFGYRANLMMRLGGSWFQPHVLGALGGATVASSSPLMAKESDPVFVWGLGAQFAMADGWQLRFDGRQVVSESIDGGTTSGYELLLSAGMRFGKQGQQGSAPPVVERPPPVIVVDTPPPLPPPDPNFDTDRDGIADRIDACPQQKETVNGFDDGDGCPESDLDNDKVFDSADKCPDRAEDVDKFEDDDGCPDDDNDKDGFADARDKCPNEPETKNNIDDDDGCPDQLPASLIAALASASAAKFDANSVRVSPKVKTALDKALLAMLGNSKLKFVVTVHPEQDGDKDATLARKRAENVKGYLLEQGAAMGSLSTAVGAVIADKTKPVVVISVAP
jgi:OOP family OmpA-OmpF porin